MQEPKKAEQQSSDSMEIVELDERLDMAFDPLSMIAAIKTGPPNTNCNNTQCCGGGKPM